MSTIDLSQAKLVTKGVTGLLTEEGKLVLVIDTTAPIGHSKNDNEVYASTNGFAGTPFGTGIFLNLIVGRRKAKTA